MQVLNQNEETTAESLSIGMIAGTADVPGDHQGGADPLVPTTNLPVNASRFPHQAGQGDDDDDEFTLARDRSRFLRYTRAILTLSSSVLLDLTNAQNKSVVSRIIRVVATGFSYVAVYTSFTGMMLWAVAYLMDHGWYLLAVTTSVVLLLVCGVLLAFYEWMWQWQGRAMTNLCSNNSRFGYNRLRSVNVLDDDEMEDDLSLRGWIKQIVHALVTCSIWSLFCVLNVKVDFWITDQYIHARPAFFRFELILVNCLEAAPILLGAAVLLYYAYPSFYRLEFSRDQLSSSGTIAGAVDTIDIPFASTEDVDNERYTIAVDEDNEVSMGVGMQNLII